MQALFPMMIEAATTLNIDQDFVKELQAAISSLPALPQRNPDGTTLLKDGESHENAIIANSYTLKTTKHNGENIGLEPVWPYSLIGDDGPLHDLGVRTYMNRPNKLRADWSADPVQAARLGLSSEVKGDLVALTEKYQGAPSGLAQFSPRGEFYVEQVGVVADAIQNALVQDYDDLLRIAPAWPMEWSADGSVSIAHGGRVYVQIRRGKVVTVGVRAGSTTILKIRNPWQGRMVKIVDASNLDAVIKQSADPVFEISMVAGKAYILEPSDGSLRNAPYAPVSGLPAEDPKHLGQRTIGLEVDSHPTGRAQE
jgi:hypothetical protein